MLTEENIRIIRTLQMCHSKNHAVVIFFIKNGLKGGCKLTQGLLDGAKFIPFQSLMTVLTLPYPLYHGTGAAFWPDIVTKGLGHCNFARDWRAAEFLDQIRELCRGHQAYEQYSLCMERMIGDWDSDRSPTPSNWRQGGVYLTSSLETATGYARNQGPEMIAYGFEVLEGCHALDRPEARAFLEGFPEIMAWRAARVGPMVLQVTHLDPSELRSETGDNVAEELACFLDESRSEFERSLIASTFEYRGCLPSKALIRLEID